MSFPKKPVEEYTPEYPGLDEGRRTVLLLLGGAASSVLLGACSKKTSSREAAKRTPGAARLKADPPLSGGPKPMPPDPTQMEPDPKPRLLGVPVLPTHAEPPPRARSLNLPRRIARLNDGSAFTYQVVISYENPKLVEFLRKNYKKILGAINLLVSRTSYDDMYSRGGRKRVATRIQKRLVKMFKKASKEDPRVVAVELKSIHLRRVGRSKGTRPGLNLPHKL